MAVLTFIGYIVCYEGQGVQKEAIVEPKACWDIGMMQEMAYLAMGEIGGGGSNLGFEQFQSPSQAQGGGVYHLSEFSFFSSPPFFSCLFLCFHL